ncbi:MAG: (2Fe-2S)-binding protein [Candidatus Caldarchaeum sp.]|nr:(2Fe-2S)-binding protein [Candidatus Caldarchaeum sp.]MCS7137864.1 (2Fe-2S)-binding protein [Candidatus Caldarchaeum sp.]MDW7978917.1 (2Fe-2S)-binding protein [Candidatus Caldarchaeum sp.]MDW8359200.1 (2Fe-2S)-binding protein [Candidatus Caldarchaeum sp.]
MVLKTSVEVELKVNGSLRKAKVNVYTTLAELLREKFGLTGTKLGCNRGECGACTVVMDGKPVYSCMVLAVDADGSEVLTVEGLSAGEGLHPLQKLFIEHDALQCGYCTPGFLMSLTALFQSREKITLEDIKHSVAGVVCRCGAHPNILRAAAEYAGLR